MHLPDWLFQVSADKYVSSEWTGMLGFEREVSRRGRKFATVTVRIGLIKKDANR